MRQLLFTLFLFAAIASTAQNLVINPGFEEYGADADFDLADGFKSSKVPGWYQASGGSSDYYRIAPGRPDEVDFMKRVPGYLKPNSGNCFAGFHTHSSGGYTEYVGGTLEQPLEKGKTYKIALALALGPSCSNGATELGLYFSDKKIAEKTTQLIHEKPQLRFDSTATKEISGRWMVFTAEYVAAGGERYFAIGNFVGKKAKVPGKHLNGYAYYLLDDVTVIPADGDLSEMPVAAEPDPVPGQATVVHVESPSMQRKEVDTIAAGKTLVMNNIYFETGKSELLSASYPPLYTLLAALKAQPNLKVEIGGHTDDVGDPASNQLLSEERAKAVMDFFTANGIDPSRITWKGYGSSKPIGDNKDRNRRVEFKFSE